MGWYVRVPKHNTSFACGCCLPSPYPQKTKVGVGRRWGLEKGHTSLTLALLIPQR